MIRKRSWFGLSRLRHRARIHRAGVRQGEVVSCLCSLVVLYSTPKQSPVLLEPFAVSDCKLQVRVHQFRGQLRCRVSVSRDAGKVFYPKRSSSSLRLVELSEGEDSAHDQVFVTLYSSRCVLVRGIECVIDVFLASLTHLSLSEPYQVETLTIFTN